MTKNGLYLSRVLTTTENSFNYTISLLKPERNILQGLSVQIWIMLIT